MIILDTNIVSEFDKPKPDSNAENWFRRQDFTELYLTGPTVMEQAYGAERIFLRSGSQRYLLLLHGLIETSFRGRVLEFTGQAPMIAGKVRATREKMGRPMSVQDSMIAAISLVHNAMLATRNIRDFEDLGLNLVNPFE